MVEMMKYLKEKVWFLNYYRAGRIVYIDVLRVIAVYLVIYTHTADMGSKLYTYGDNGIGVSDIVDIMLDVFRNINVPIFFMISGYLMLGKKETYKRIFTRILRYIEIIVITSYFYWVFSLGHSYYEIKQFILEVWEKPVVGHLWFLYTYIGYLLIMPFLRKMVSSMQAKDYHLLIFLGVLFQGIASVVCGIIGLPMPGVSFKFALIYIFYPLVGYYCGSQLTVDTIKKNISIAFIISVLCVIVSTFMTIYDMKLNCGEWSEKYLDSLIMIPTITVFCGIKYLFERRNVGSLPGHIIWWAGQTSFGVYLMSIYVQLRLGYVYRFFNQFIPSIIASLIYVLIVLIVCEAITTVLKCIPGMGKLL